MTASVTVAYSSVPVYLDKTRAIDERVEDALSRMTTEEKVAMLHAQSKFSSAGVPRLGIPEFWTTDGPHGIRPEVLWDEWDQAGWTNDSCVAFPALTCLAATWNPDMALLYGKNIGEEARYRKKDILLGPGVINKSSVLKKLKSGNRDIFKAYTAHCRYKGKFHKQLHQRSLTEIALLFVR